MRIIAKILVSVHLLISAQPLYAASVVENELSVAMLYAVDQGFLQPESDGLMHGDMPLRRLDLVKGIVQTNYLDDLKAPCFDRIASSIPATFTRLFSDISITDSHATVICVGMFVGIVNGRGNTFQPLEPATLAETTKVVAKAYGLASDEPDIRGSKGIRWDEPFWYALARRNAIPREIQNNRLSIVTREDFAFMLYALRNERPLYGAMYKTVSPKVTDHTNSSQTQNPLIVSFKDASDFVISASSSQEAVTPEGQLILAHVRIRRADREKKNIVIDTLNDTSVLQR
jgi:hypothetical protein